MFNEQLARLKLAWEAERHPDSDGSDEWRRGFYWGREQASGNETDHWIEHIKCRHAAGDHATPFERGALASMGHRLDIAAESACGIASLKRAKPARPGGAAELPGRRVAGLHQEDCRPHDQSAPSAASAQHKLA